MWVSGDSSHLCPIAALHLRHLVKKHAFFKAKLKYPLGQAFSLFLQPSVPDIFQNMYVCDSDLALNILQIMLLLIFITNTYFIE